MDLIASLGLGFSVAFDPVNILYCFLGVLLGTLVGVLPGIGATLVLWLVGGTAFGLYLESFATSYVSTYAGLASGMIVLVFLYILSAIFIFGGELNAALIRERELQAGGL